MMIGDQRWRKASASGGEGGQCVELHPAGGVRDSKNANGPQLQVALAGLLTAVKADRFSR